MNYYQYGFNGNTFVIDDITKDDVKNGSLVRLNTNSMPANLRSDPNHWPHILPRNGHMLALRRITNDQGHTELVGASFCLIIGELEVGGVYDYFLQMIDPAYQNQMHSARMLLVLSTLADPDKFPIINVKSAIGGIVSTMIEERLECISKSYNAALLVSSIGTAEFFGKAKLYLSETLPDFQEIIEALEIDFSAEKHKLTMS